MNEAGRFDQIYEGRRVLVTGHTGFKGAWLSLWLLLLKADIIGYALKPPTKPSLFEICGLEHQMASVHGDVRDRKSLQEAMERYRPEIVFHLAAQALVPYSYQEPVETYETNVMGTVNLLEICRHTPSVRVIVIVTSDKCYENQGWVWGYRESDAMGGSDPYSSSKGCAELITSAYTRSYFNPVRYKEHGKSLASVRAGNVIGGGDWAKDRLIPDCMRACMAQESILIRYPEAVRPWQHVLDPLFGYLLLGQRLWQEGPAFAEAWNFGPNEENAKPVKWVVEHLTRAWGDEVRWQMSKDEHPHEAQFLKLDSSKARARIGWHSRWNLATAIDETIRWYKAYCRGGDMSRFTTEQIERYGKSVGTERMEFL